MRFIMAFFAFLLLSVAPAADSVSDDLNAVLSKPEYSRWNGGDDTAGQLNALLQTMRSWFEQEKKAPQPKPVPKRVNEPRRRPMMPSAGDASGFFAIIGYGLLIVTGLFLLYAIIEGLREGGGKAAKQAGAAGVGVARALADGDALAFTDTVWRDEAERLLSRGEIRLAYRSLYLGLLSGLHQRGRIVFAANRTNWHYVRMFQGAAESRAEFSSMTALFDEIWYGLHDALSAKGLEEMERRVAELLAAHSTKTGAVTNQQPR